MLTRCAGWNARLAARLITQFLDRELAPTGLSIAQLGMLAEIAASPDDTLSAIAARAGLEQSTLSRSLHALAREGLVEIAMVESDLRRRMVWLTEFGARRLEKAIPVWRSAHEKLGARPAASLARQLAADAQALAEALR
jgi:DNA-binding MarR family transcriptional regulator